MGLSDVPPDKANARRFAETHNGSLRRQWAISYNFVWQYAFPGCYLPEFGPRAYLYLLNIHPSSLILQTFKPLH